MLIKKNIRWVVMSALLVSGVSATYLILNNHAPEAGRETGETLGATVSALSAPNAEAARKRSDQNGAHAKIEIGSSKIKIGDPLFEPKNKQEVDWLNKNSFPSKEALDAAMRGTASQLDFDIRDGASAREIIRAEQLALQDPSQSGKAIEFLTRAAVQGSIYALEALGRLHAGPGSFDLLQSESYFKAAALRGDWNMYGRIRPNLTSEQDYISSLMAQQLIHNIDRVRKNQGLLPLGQDMRPGLDAYLKEIARAEANGG